MAKIPEGFHTVTPYLVVADGAGALTLYENAFGAQNLMRMPMPGDSNKIMHACFSIGDSKLFLCDENPEQGMIAPGKGDGPEFYLYFEDVDAQHQQAVSAGMTQISVPTDMFWGDRMSVVQDPYGQTWTLATHVRDVSEEEMAEAMAQMAP